MNKENLNEYFDKTTLSGRKKEEIKTALKEKFPQYSQPAYGNGTPNAVINSEADEYKETSEAARVKSHRLRSGIAVAAAAVIVTAGVTFLRNNEIPNNSETNSSQGSVLHKNSSDEFAKLLCMKAYELASDYEVMGISTPQSDEDGVSYDGKYVYGDYLVFSDGQYTPDDDFTYDCKITDKEFLISLFAEMFNSFTDGSGDRADPEKVEYLQNSNFTVSIDEFGNQVVDFTAPDGNNSKATLELFCQDGKTKNKALAAYSEEIGNSLLDLFQECDKNNIFYKTDGIVYNHQNYQKFSSEIKDFSLNNAYENAADYAVSKYVDNEILSDDGIFFTILAYAGNNEYVDFARDDFRIYDLGDGMRIFFEIDEGDNGWVIYPDYKLLRTSQNTEYIENIIFYEATNALSDFEAKGITVRSEVSDKEFTIDLKNCTPISEEDIKKNHPDGSEVSAEEFGGYIYTQLIENSDIISSDIESASVIMKADKNSHATEISSVELAYVSKVNTNSDEFYN